MSQQERVVAVGLLSERELAIVGQTLRRVYRIDERDCFDDLLRAIDEADGLCAKSERQLDKAQIERRK